MLDFKCNFIIDFLDQIPTCLRYKYLLFFFWRNVLYCANRKIGYMIKQGLAVPLPPAYRAGIFVNKALFRLMAAFLP